MKSIKIISLISVLILSTQMVFASNAEYNPNSLDYMENSDIDNVVNIDSMDNYTIFDENSTKVIHTKKGAFWKGFSFKKKNDNDGEKPVVIDYDYDTETEEIIPVVQEKKVEKTIEVKTDDNNVKDKNNEKKKNNKSENIDYSNTTVNIYCDNMTYNDEKKEITGTGNAKVVFTENNAYMTAKKIVYNHDLNYFEGFDDVKIVRDGITLEGDYTKVDLNYGNVLVDNPLIDNYLVRISAKSGKATTDSLEAYDGTAQINADYEHLLYSSQQSYLFQMDVNPTMYRKFYPKEYRNPKTKYHIKTKELYVNSTDGHDSVTFKNADIYAGKLLLLKGTDLTLSSDKSQNFVETTLPEIGSMRYVGAYIGPGFVFNTPKSSTLKLAPILTYDSGDFGIGILARFRHRYNLTTLIYSSAANEFVAKGKQKLGDSDFQLEYSHLSYANDWFFGSGISKNLVQLAYHKRYIMPELGSTFAHRITGGYLTDEKGNTGTLRFRYMAQFTQRLASYEDYDRKLYAHIDLITQGVMGLYGTGDSAGAFRIGPSLTTQYRGWRQQIVYYQTAVGGASPLKYTDNYRYGHSTVSLVESLRLNKYISLGYYAVLNLNDDDGYTKNMFSESRISVSFGPEDAKISLGYDMIRQGARLNYTALIGSKNQKVSFKKLFMKNPDKAGKETRKKKQKSQPADVEQEVSPIPQNNDADSEDVIMEDKDFENSIESPLIFSF